MKSFKKLYVKVSSLAPKKTVKSYEQLLIAADMPDTARSYIGSSSLISLILAIIFAVVLLVSGLAYELAAIGGIVAFIALLFVFYYRIVLAADARAAQMEKYLPEALQLISANIRTGMTVDRALWLCARPEFGPFEKELRKMAAETLGGKPVTQALAESAQRLKSVTMDRAYRLLIQGIELGGALASLLTEIASDIRTNQALRNEITAATAMYTIFIIFASVLASPMLFAVSSFYVQATNKIWSAQASQAQEESNNIQSQTSVFKLSTEQSLSFEEVRLFSIVCLVITTFFGALIIGMIKDGAAKRGIKYVPLFVTGALVIYYVTYLVVSSAFSEVIR